MNELKPCPFCFGNETYPVYKNQPATHFFIKCTECGACGPEIERNSVVDEWTAAAEKWNQRANSNR